MYSLLVKFDLYIAEIDTERKERTFMVMSSKVRGRAAGWGHGGVTKRLLCETYFTHFQNDFHTKIIPICKEGGMRAAGSK